MGSTIVDRNVVAGLQVDGLRVEHVQDQGRLGPFVSTANVQPRLLSRCKWNLDAFKSDQVKGRKSSRGHSDSQESVREIV